MGYFLTAETEKVMPGQTRVPPKTHTPGSPVKERGDENCYFVIATTESRAFLDIRTYDKDRVIQSVVLSSRYMPPYFEAKDVVGDNGVEFLVYTRDGGTDIAETHLKIYGVINNNIRKLGDFIVDHQSESWPEPTEKQTIKGDVTFPATDQLVYAYTRVLTHDGKTATNTVSETYVFNIKVDKFKRTTSPNIERVRTSP